MPNKKNTKGKTGNIRNLVKKMKIDTFYIVDFYDIKCEMGVCSHTLSENEINMARVRTIGKLSKVTDLQISLSTFFNLDADDHDDEDFVHIPIGCIFEIHKLSY